MRNLTAVAHDIAEGSVAAYYPEANVLIGARSLRRKIRNAVLQIDAGADPRCGEQIGRLTAAARRSAAR